MTKLTGDAASGALLSVIGLLAAVISSDYSMGTAQHMGPGLFPLIVSGLLVLVGLALLWRSRASTEAPITVSRLRPVILVVASIVAFALIVERLGLFLAILITLICASAASGRFRFSILPVFGAVVLSAVCTLVFSVFLGLPMPVVGDWLQPLLTW